VPQAFDTHPLYALLHEAIYCEGGGASNWSAQVNTAVGALSGQSPRQDWERLCVSKLAR
jgi:hypothetical protein